MTGIKFNADQNNVQKGLVPSFNNVFDSIFTDSFFSGSDMAMVPAVNICESKDQFAVELAAPGLAKEDFKINLERRMLSIAVDKQPANDQTEKMYSRKEFGYSSFTRSFTLPESADENNISAKYVDGVLYLDIPKEEEAKITSRQISIS